MTCCFACESSGAHRDEQANPNAGSYARAADASRRGQQSAIGAECYAWAKDAVRPAVEAVVGQLRPRLTRMSAYYARRTGEDADDLLQEAWCGLLDALRELDPLIGSPEQFLIQRARWRMLDAVKRSRVRRCLPLDSASDTPIGAHNPTCAYRASTADMYVRDFAARLKPSQRAVLGCLMVGLTWRETGDRLGCTSANVAYHVRQIRRQYEEWSGE